MKVDLPDPIPNEELETLLKKMIEILDANLAAENMKSQDS